MSKIKYLIGITDISNNHEWLYRDIFNRYCFSNTPSTLVFDSKKEAIRIIKRCAEYKYRKNKGMIKNLFIDVRLEGREYVDIS